MKSRILKTADINWRSLLFLQDESFKDITRESLEKLKKSLVVSSFTMPFFVWEEPETGALYCLDGYHRSIGLGELESEGVKVPKVLPAVFIDCSSKQDAAQMVLQYSSQYARVTSAGFASFVETYNLEEVGMSDIYDIPFLPIFEIPANTGTPEGGENTGTPEDERKPMDLGKPGNITDVLLNRFLWPPFSVLDSKTGRWQDKKRKYGELGMDSQQGREDNLTFANSAQGAGIYDLRNRMREFLGRDPEWEEIIEQANIQGLALQKSTSIFDPVLCELLYHWFCPPGGKILDPFAGGVVRGFVANLFGFEYDGIDIRKEQVEANYEQLQSDRVRWYIGDSQNIKELAPGEYDFFFSCPPYADLEKYSDDPADISNMEYPAFLAAYREIIAKGLGMVKPDRFACFIVSEVRAKTGEFYGFVQDTIEAFEAAGFLFYNEIILLNQIGSTAIRVGRFFVNSRKVGRIHQNVLVFYKGDISKIKDNYPEIDLPEDIFGDGGLENTVAEPNDLLAQKLLELDQKPKSQIEGGEI